MTCTKPASVIALAAMALCLAPPVQAGQAEDGPSEHALHESHESHESREWRGPDGGAASGSTTPLTAASCEQVLKLLSKQLADATCVVSTDLTTANAATTPADNSLPGLPAAAFTPRGDRGVLVDLVSQPPVSTPIAAAVPGLQISARFASDTLGQARFLLRLPNNWNGRLVVAGASAQRSEFNGDMAWSDYVVQKGYAYASQNKGTLNFYFSTAADPLACRLNPASTLYVHFYDDDSGQRFTRWTRFMVEAAQVAREGVRAAYGKSPRRTYAVGTSNGGYQVRRALEVAPELFDGGVDSEGTFVDETAPNLLSDLPAGVLNLPDYAASGYSPTSTAARNLLAAGYPPDVSNPAATPSSLLQRYYNSYWELTLCQWQKRLDLGYDSYVSGLAHYNYQQRLALSDVGAQVAAIATTGRIGKPLITVAGTLDALLPIDHHARAYQRAVQRHAHRHSPAYRLYEVQNATHIENYKAFYPQLEYLLPHTHAAFDLLVSHVEQGAELPPDQCVPRGHSISAEPDQPGHCQALLVAP